MGLFKVTIEGDVGGLIEETYFKKDKDLIDWDTYFKRLLEQGVFDDWLEDDCGGFCVRATYDWNEYIDFSLIINRGHLFCDQRFTRSMKSSNLM